MSVPCIKIFSLSHKNLFIHFLLSFSFSLVLSKKIQFYAPLIVHAPLNVMNNREQEQRRNCWCDVKIQREYNFLRSFLLCHLYLHIDWLFVGFYGTSCVMYGKRQQKDTEKKIIYWHWKKMKSFKLICHFQLMLVSTNREQIGNRLLVYLAATSEHN